MMVTNEMIDAALQQAGSQWGDFNSPENRRKLMGEALIAALAAAPQAAGVPSGWKLVPVEPTEAMTIAGIQSCLSDEEGYSDEVVGAVYRAMLSASPTPPADDLKVENERLRKEAEDSRREAQILAQSMWEQSYSHVTQWKMLDDTAGIIIQISNMAAGIRDRATAAEAREKTLREALETIDGASMSQFGSIAHFLEYVLRTARTALKGGAA